MEDLDCMLFVDTNVARSQLSEFIAGQVRGSAQGEYVHAESLEVEIRENEDFNPDRLDDPENGFLFYPVYLEITPTANVSRAAYISDVAAIMSALRGARWRAVASCDFEDELPQ